MTEVRTQGFASPSDVKLLVSAWSPDILYCRMYGHQWEPYTCKQVPKYKYYHTTMVCYRCKGDATHGVEKHSQINMKGQVIASWLQYVNPDYLTKGFGRIAGSGRDIVRLAAATKLFNLEVLSNGSSPQPRGKKRVR